MYASANLASRRSAGATKVQLFSTVEPNYCWNMAFYTQYTLFSKVPMSYISNISNISNNTELKNDLERNALKIICFSKLNSDKTIC